MKINLIHTKDKILDAAVVALVAALYFCIILPLSTFWANTDVFLYGTGDLLIDLSWRFSAWFIVGTLLLFFSSFAIGKLLHAAVLAVVAAAMVEVGPLSIGLPELNGVLDGYQSNIRSVIDAQVISAIIVAALVWRRIICRHIKIVAIILLIYSCATLLDTNAKDVKSLKSSEMCADALVPRQEVVQSVEYSGKRNIFLLILDSITIDAARDVFIADESLRNKFPGFVNYIDNLGMHWYTTVAIPGIMTGKHYSRASELGEYGQASFSTNSFICEYISHDVPVYVNLGINTRGYTNRLKKNQDSACPRPTDYRMDGIISWDIDRLCLFRLCPYFLKSDYIIKTGSQNPERKNKAANINVSQDSVLWPILAKGVVNPNSKCALNIHHVKGGHPPIINDADGNKIECIKPGYKEYLGHCQYAFRLLGVYMDELRKKGVYDNSTIIVTADHGLGFAKPGSDTRGLRREAFPFMMIKPPNATAPYHESTLPTSHTRIAPLVKALLYGDLDDKAINDMLRCGDRMCRYSAKGEMTEWIVKADGSVDIRTYRDEEPDRDSLRPLELNRKYLFKIGAAGKNYPDFVLANGSRNSSIGIHVVPNQSTEPMRLTIRTGCPNEKLKFSLGVCSRRKNRIIAIANDVRLESIGTEDEWKSFSLIFDDVMTDAKGYVDFSFDCTQRDESFAIRNIEVMKSTGIAPRVKDSQSSPNAEISIPAKPIGYNWKRVDGDALLPGKSYMFTADEVIADPVTTEAVEVMLYETKTRRFGMRKKFLLENGRCENLSWHLTVPNSPGDYCILVYAGIVGKCENIGATWKNVVVSETNQSE